MRVNNAVSYRFYVRAPLVAALVCASLTLSGCAAWRDLTGPSAPVNAPSTAVTASSTRFQEAKPL